MNRKRLGSCSEDDAGSLASDVALGQAVGRAELDLDTGGDVLGVVGVHCQSDFGWDGRNGVDLEHLAFIEMSVNEEFGIVFTVAKRPDFIDEVILSGREGGNRINPWVEPGRYG